MKKVHLLKTMRTVLQTVPVVFAGLLLASCAQDGFDNDEKWESSVSDTQMVSPTASTVEIAPDATGNYQIISWPVVLGAGGYECKLVDITDPDKHVVLFSEVVDGCSFRAAREDDAVYEVYIKTLGNKEKNNTDAKETTKLEYNTIIKTQDVIPSGSDLTTYFANASTNLPDNEIDATTKQVIPLAYDLEADGTYTMTGTVDFGFHKVMLRTQKTKDGVVVKPVNYATVTLQAPTVAEGEEPAGGKTCFRIQHGFTLKGVKFDCTNMSGNSLIAMAKAEDVSPKVKTNEMIYKTAQSKNAFATEEPIEVRNCWVKNLKKSLFDINGTGWVISSFNLIGNIIQLNKEGEAAFLNFHGATGGVVKNLLVQNNTIFDIGTESGAYFLRFAHNGNYKYLADGNNPAKNTIVLEYKNNTFMRTFINKAFDDQISNNACVHHVKSHNIYLDVFNQQRAIANQDKAFDNSTNFIWKIECASIHNTDKTVIATEEDPGFTTPKTELDLTKENAGLTGLTPAGGALAKRSGDPRWLPTE